MSRTLNVQGRALPVDKEGYLQERSDWSTEVAEALAEIEQIELTEAHWAVIHLLRQHDQTHGKAPAMRALVNLIKTELGPDKARSRYLYQLFPKGSARQGCKIAGLPKPVGCI
ncbi:MAG: TusE/DsrC/DsvC family sulfur relay protein [Gammaproteobacteria bacterium]|nr:TusE/DsrC/DsvC family sulfur relay protein [Gammaproteobacteria bacterium]